MPNIFKPQTHTLPPVPIRTMEHGLVGHPEIDATPSAIFLIYGYTDLQTSYRNLLTFMPIILLDHAYHHLKLYRDFFDPKGREKQLVNMALDKFHRYFSCLLSSKNDDVMHLLDDMEEMQCRFTLQYTLLQHALQNNNFHRRTLTDDQSRKYGYLISIITELVHAHHIAQSLRLMTDKGHKQILDFIEGPLFDYVIPRHSKMQQDDSDLCNQTIRKVNSIISTRLDELKASDSKN